MNRRFIPLWVSLALLLVLFLVGSIQFPYFASVEVVTNLLTDNAFLLVTALGMMLVILTGGIDLSVGSMIALTGVLCAVFIEGLGWHPLVAFAAVICLAALFGGIMGSLIYYYRLQPFIVTLAGMFLARGLATVFSEQSLPIEHEFYDWLADAGVALPQRGWLSSSAIMTLVFVVGTIILVHFTRFGRYLYAVGGNQHSAALMGVPMARTTISVYVLSSVYAAVAGIIFSLYTFSGYALRGVGLELDAIAAVVIGGTLLSGGHGYVVGTVLGVLLMGTIQTYIIFDGTLNSWWSKIVIGVLLFDFIAMQRLLRQKQGNLA